MLLPPLGGVSGCLTGPGRERKGGGVTHQIDLSSANRRGQSLVQVGVGVQRRRGKESRRPGTECSNNDLERSGAIMTLNEP